MNASWEGKDRLAARDRKGEAYCVNWQAALSSPSPSSDRVRAPRPARGAPFTIHLELALRVVVLPMIYAVMMRTDPEPLPADFAEQMIDLLIGGLGSAPR